ncbi:MAG TPA: hypothetical protein VJX67_15145 [Blastocatellia bacterium]|nr:hypothetical protein [Blastocatellia bacterium]
MSIASSFYPFDRENVVYAPEDWLELLGDFAERNPERAGAMALLFSEIIRAVRGGPAGIERGVNTLKVGLEHLFPLTREGELCFRLFLYQLEGFIGGNDWTPQLIGGAIERAEAQAKKFLEADSGQVDGKRERAKKRKPGRKGKRPESEK